MPCRANSKTKGGTMKRTMIATLAAVGAVLAAAYLTGADGTPAQQTPTPAQQFMQEPSVETVECDGYILLMPCPVCHTCPICQANCGSAHLLKCSLGNKKTTSAAQNCTSGAQDCTPAAGTPKQQHVMTNKAEAVKHAAGTAPAASTVQTDTWSLITVEEN